jgi:8-oxo-dGTP pyrophosphatase MutT (NUDIX family)
MTDLKVMFLKAFVKPHLRDGKLVQGYHRSDAIQAPKHPRPGEKGEAVFIHAPHTATGPEAWHDAKHVATVLPDGALPAELHGVPFAPWDEAPHTAAGWDFVDGINEALDEPPLKLAGGKAVSSGVVIEEPDGRVWLVAPTNGFGGYDATFPKGKAEPELSLQANAIKEAFEESGLQVEITGMVGDFERTTSVARLYKARRVGGTPAAMGWESQSVHLVPREKLYAVLNHSADHAVAEALGAEAPPKPSIKQGGNGKWKPALF